MARSLVGGLISNKFDRSSITVSDPDSAAREHATNNFQVAATADNDEVIAKSSAVMLAVKPQIMKDVLESSRPAFQQHRPLLISVAAGITTESIDTWCGGDFAIVRVMPNTPALIQLGMSGLYANDRVSPGQKTFAESILSAVGKTVWMNQESEINAVTAVSGSGPAYVYYLIESMQAGAVELGLNEEDARTLAIQTAIGAATLAQHSDEPAETLRKQVMSPGGTTEAAVRVLESQKVKDIFVQAIAAAENRAVELSKPTN